MTTLGPIRVTDERNADVIEIEAEGQCILGSAHRRRTVGTVQILAGAFM